MSQFRKNSGVSYSDSQSSSSSSSRNNSSSSQKNNNQNNNLITTYSKNNQQDQFSHYSNNNNINNYDPLNNINNQRKERTTYSHYSKNHIRSLQNSVNRKDSYEISNNGINNPRNQNRNRFDSGAESSAQNSNSKTNEITSSRSSIDDFEKQQIKQKLEIQEIIQQEFEKQQYREKLEIKYIIEQEMKKEVDIEHNISQDKILFEKEYEKHRVNGGAKSRRNSFNKSMNQSANKSIKPRNHGSYITFNLVEEITDQDQNNNPQSSYDSKEQLEKSGFHHSMIKEAYIHAPSKQSSNNLNAPQIKILSQDEGQDHSSSPNKSRKSGIQSIEEMKEKEEKAILIIQSEQTNQAQSLQNRLRNRKIQKMNKNQMDLSVLQNNMQNKSILSGIFPQNNLLSPQYMSSGQKFQFGNTMLSPDQNDKTGNQNSGNNLQNNNNSGEDLSGVDNFFLRDLDDNLDLNDQYEAMMEEDGDIGDQEEAETLQELEKRKEEILEEFLEYAFAKKHEAVENVKSECKKLKAPKDQEKKQIQEVQKDMDLRRKEGMNELAKKMHAIIYDENIPIHSKAERMQDKETIQQYIESVFAQSQPQVDSNDQS